MFTLALRLLCLLVLSCGCGNSVPRIRPLRTDSVVLAFGDSLTAGSGISSRDTYPALLADQLGCTVVNAGVGGEVTSDGLRRLPAVLRQYQPELIILCHGGNDLLRRHDESVVAANLAQMIEMIQASGADVLLVGVPKPGLILRTAPVYGKLSGKYRIPHESKIVAEILSTPSLKNDQIHPNADGNRRLAEAVAALIIRSQSG